VGEVKPSNPKDHMQVKLKDVYNDLPALPVEFQLEGASQFPSAAFFGDHVSQSQWLLSPVWLQTIFSMTV